VKPALLAVLMLSIALLAGCTASDESQVYTIEGPIMGTQYHVKVVLGPERVALLPQLQEGVLQALREVDTLMSTYKPDSEISRFNRLQSQDWYSLSPATFEVLDLGLDISKKTNGAFDMTVGPLVNLWGFGPERRPDQIPTAATVRKIKQSVGYRLLELRQDPFSLRKKKPQVQVDLSAIAKGYAVDRVASYLLGQEVGDFLVEVGGEIRINGEKPDGETWRLAIESPQENQRQVHRVLKVTNVAMATSGEYRNYYEMDGKRFSHTVDPRTGFTINHTLASVSVIDASCARADALATAFMVMGTKQAMEYAVKNNVAAYFIDRENGTFRALHSPAFERYLQR